MNSISLKKKLRILGNIIGRIRQIESLGIFLARLTSHNMLWSRPASGNHWVRFIAEYVTGHPTGGCINNKQDAPIHLHKFPDGDKPLSHVKARKTYVLHKEHNPDYLCYRYHPIGLLILLIRDFHEYIAHRSGYTNFVSLETEKQYYLLYIELIKAYDDFTGTKIVIYYEDLILKPEREILRIKNILGGSEIRYKTLIHRYDYYAKLSRNAKGRSWFGSHSEMELTFHRTKSDKKELQRRLELFHKLLSNRRFQQVKPYLDRYLR